MELVPPRLEDGFRECLFIAMMGLTFLVSFLYLGGQIPGLDAESAGLMTWASRVALLVILPLLIMLHLRDLEVF